MADLGFMPAVTQLLDLTPEGEQRMLFSATLDGAVEKLVVRYLNNPALHAVKQVQNLCRRDGPHVFTVRADDKLAVTAEIVARPGRTLLFVRTKHGADRLAKQLERAGVEAAAIHGDLKQNARQRALDASPAGSPRVLVATDVAARGIHVDDVDLVIQLRPAGRPQGLPAPFRSHRPGRQHRHRADAGRSRAAPRGQAAARRRRSHGDVDDRVPGSRRGSQIAESGHRAGPPLPVRHPSSPRRPSDGPRRSPDGGRARPVGTAGGYQGRPANTERTFTTRASGQCGASGRFRPGRCSERALAVARPAPTSTAPAGTSRAAVPRRSDLTDQHYLHDAVPRTGLRLRGTLPYGDNRRVCRTFRAPLRIRSGQRQEPGGRQRVQCPSHAIARAGRS